MPTFLVRSSHYISSSNVDNWAPLLADTLEGNIFIGFASRPPRTNSRVEDSIDIDGINIMKREVSSPFAPFSFNTGGIKVPFSPTQIASLKNHSIDVGSNDLTIPPITINKVGCIVTASHDGIFQVASNQDGHLTEFPLTMGEIAVNEFTANSSIISSVGRLRNNLLENSSSEIGTFQINRSNTRTTPTDVGQDSTLKVSLPSIVSSQQLFSRDLCHTNTSLLTSIYSTAQNLWQTTIPIDLTFNITNLPTGQLAVRVALR